MATTRMMIGDCSQIHSPDTVTQYAISAAVLSRIGNVIFEFGLMQRNLVQDQ